MQTDDAKSVDLSADIHCEESDIFGGDAYGIHFCIANRDEGVYLLGVEHPKVDSPHH